MPDYFQQSFILAFIHTSFCPCSSAYHAYHSCSTQYEVASEPRLDLVQPAGTHTSRALLVSEGLAKQLQRDPPKDLGTYQQALGFANISLPQSSHVEDDQKRLSFLASSEPELPFACYTAMLWAAMSSHSWSVGLVSQ